MRRAYKLTNTPVEKRMAPKTSFGIRQVTPLPLLATKVMPYLADVYHGHQPRRAYSAAASSALKVEIGYVGGTSSHNRSGLHSLKQ
jgi:hypothetical protein